MRPTRTASLLAAITSALLVAAGAAGALVPTDGGLTVHDTVLHVTWLADANLAGTAAGRFGVAKIMPNGAMSYGRSAGVSPAGSACVPPPRLPKMFGVLLGGQRWFPERWHLGGLVHGVSPPNRQDSQLCW